MDTAAARLEEVVVVDADPEPGAAVRVDRAGDVFRIGAAEERVFEGEIAEAPCLELADDHRPERHGCCTSRRMQTRRAGSRPETASSARRSPNSEPVSSALNTRNPCFA